MIPIQLVLKSVLRGAKAASGMAGITRSIGIDSLRLSKVILGGEKRRRKSEKKLGVPVPRFCIFSVTWRCNLNCSGCYATNYRHRKDLPLDTIEKIIRDSNQLGTFGFVIAGGEPFLVEGLISSLASVKDALFFVFTNGTLLDDEQVSVLKKARNVFPVVSVEGDRLRTDSRRGEGVWEMASEVMDKLKQAGVLFGVSAMATHQNVELITSRDWHEQMWTSGVRFIFAIDYQPFPHNLEPDFVLTDEDMAFKAVELEKRYAEARPIVINFPYDEYYDGECHAAGRGFIHVNADGYVEPCPYSHFAADNAAEKPLPEILASPFMTAIRDEMATLPNTKRQCLLFNHRDEVKDIAARTGAFETESNNGRDESQH